MKTSIVLRIKAKDHRALKSMSKSVSRLIADHLEQVLAAPNWHPEEKDTTVQTSVAVPVELAEKARALALAKNMTMSELMNAVVKEIVRHDAR